MTRRHNPHRVKQDATYTASEIAERFKVTTTAVRQWVSKGLAPIDRHVPYLFHGRDVRVFIGKLNKPRQPLGPGEFYCVACKTKVLPARGEIWLTPRSATTADFTCTCSGCARTIFRRVRVDQVQAKLGAAKLVHEDDKAHVSRDGHCPHTPRQAGSPS